MEIRTQNKYKKQKKKIKYAGESQINPAKQMEQNSKMDVPHLIILFLFLLQYKKDDKLVTKLFEDKARHKYINQML